jgi:hypothetical protein
MCKSYSVSDFLVSFLEAICHYSSTGTYGSVPLNSIEVILTMETNVPLLSILKGGDFIENIN